jgi:hypothetical protein
VVSLSVIEESGDTFSSFEELVVVNEPEEVESGSSGRILIIISLGSAGNSVKLSCIWYSTAIL